jgi:hypothetical protein
MTALLDRIRERFAKFPRLMRFIGVAGLLAVVATPMVRLIPRDLVIRYDFGDHHADVRSLRVAYVPRGQDSARVLTQNFPQGADRKYDHAVDLAPGIYEVHARVETTHGMNEVTRTVEIGREDVIEVEVEARGERSLFDP